MMKRALLVLAVALGALGMHAAVKAEPVDGPKTFSGTLGGPDKIDRYFVTLKGGTSTEIIVRVTPNDADVDLVVVDANTDQVLKADRKSDDDCFVRFYVPKRTQVMIKLVNFRTGKSPRYTMFVNQATSGLPTMATSRRGDHERGSFRRPFA